MMFCTACHNPYFLSHMTVVNHYLYTLQFILWSLNPRHAARDSAVSSVAGVVSGFSRNEPGPAQRDRPRGSNPANLLCEDRRSSSPC